MLLLKCASSEEEPVKEAGFKYKLRGMGCGDLLYLKRVGVHGLKTCTAPSNAGIWSETVLGFPEPLEPPHEPSTPVCGALETVCRLLGPTLLTKVNLE